MISKHKPELYNILLTLSRNIFFYEKIKLPDTFETRIYLMFLHFSILMIVSKLKGKKFDQKSYDYLFYNIENNLRELGFGDISVNKKMKDFNKILYDILLKINLEKTASGSFKINKNIILKYFDCLKSKKNNEITQLMSYFTNFFQFCFEISLNNMIKEIYKFKI